MRWPLWLLCNTPTTVVTPGVIWHGFCTRFRFHSGDCIDHNQ